MRHTAALVVTTGISLLALVGPCTPMPGPLAERIRPALAADSTTNDGAGGSGEVDGTRIIAGVQYGTPPSNTPGTGHCTWQPYRHYENSHTQAPEQDLEQVIGGVRYELWVEQCPGTAGVWGAYWIPRLEESTLRQQARRRLWSLVPTFRLESAPSPKKMVVGVGTWIWTPRLFWHSVSVTAWVPTTAGTVSVTTTAKPRELIYVPGDGRLGTGNITCHGPGKEWLTVYGDQKRSNCMYTYNHSSAAKTNNLFNAELKTVWTVTWKSNMGVGGRLPDITTVDSVMVRVRELQAISQR